MNETISEIDVILASCMWKGLLGVCVRSPLAQSSIIYVKLVFS